MKCLIKCAGMAFALAMAPCHMAAQNRAQEGQRIDRSPPRGGDLIPSSGQLPGMQAGPANDRIFMPDASGQSMDHMAPASPANSAPAVPRASFDSMDAYYNWSNYYSYLCAHYDMSPAYFGRFYRNREPLITPEILKLTLQEPMRLSRELLDSIDQLEEMLKYAVSGAAVDRKELLDRSRHIRELARRIRSNQTLSTIDLRKDKELCKEHRDGYLNPAAIGRLRAMAADLDRQLRNLYSQPATSTVSVESYQEHSLKSLAKGIEKMCRSIENHSRRI